MLSERRHEFGQEDFVGSVLFCSFAVAMLKRIICFPILTVMLAMTFCGCAEKESPVLSRIASTVSDAPDSALMELERIDASNLSEADRHYHDLLTVKARDKAYILHTSDSLIQSCLDYYDNNKESPHYPEALYYGGRVYTDLGDYPTALKYYQAALDETQGDEHSMELRSHILSQTARLLNSLRMHSQAIPYILQSLSVDSLLKDNFNLAYDHLLLGDALQKLANNDEAEDAYRKAHEWASRISANDATDIQVYLASVKLDKGKVDSALTLIRPIADEVIPDFRNIYLAIASETYHKAGVYDTAYIYASELASSDIPDNKRIGYRMLLTPELKRYIPTDSMDRLLDEYKSTVDSYIDAHEGQQTAIQNSMYNYTLHERERDKAERERNGVYRLLVLASALFALGLICFLVRMYLQKQKMVRMQRVLFCLMDIKTSHLLDCHCSSQGRNAGMKDVQPQKKEILLLPPPDSVGSMRKRLLDELESINMSLKDMPVAPPAYFRLGVSDRIQHTLKNGRIINDTDPVWDDMEKVVLEESGNFKTNLMMLSDGKTDQTGYRIALLLRCGLGVSNIASLMGKAKSTVSKRCRQLGKKLFCEELDTKSLVCLIRLL